MNRVERWFVKRKLEKVQKRLQRGGEMKLSPTMKVLLVALGIAALQSGADYLRTDPTVTVGELLNAVGAAVIGAVLYWLRGPQAKT